MMMELTELMPHHICSSSALSIGQVTQRYINVLSLINHARPI